MSHLFGMLCFQKSKGMIYMHITEKQHFTTFEA